ncbi:sensor domain-containing diguanylate cyclase [Jeongeupia sp. HS-3]|uniref:sensor domain-containing diguanylate cyclase n=1 Tax=Jeongeupia sp. HS-3 TaxID=1009682 RepID=UPI0019105A21|nr:sensor domain-containing diguanylate cyclase [Jeongeupia sp. HS-3]
MFLILGVIWLALAERWSRAIVADEVVVMVRQLAKSKTIELRHVANRYDRRLAMLKAVPRIVAELGDVRSMLIDPASSSQAYSNTDRLLATLAQNVPVDRILIYDRDGEVLLSNDMNDRDHLLGRMIPQGPAFDAALLGGNGVHYSFGSLTGVAGVFFSAPIRYGDMVLGVAMAKVNVDTLNREIVDRDLILVDSYGVVVMASNPDFRLTAFPGGEVERMAPALRERIYRQQSFKPLIFQPVADGLPDNVVTVQGNPIPYLYLPGPAPTDNKLQIHMLLPLPQLTHLDERRGVVFWPMLSAGLLALTLGLLLLIYLVRTRLLNKQIAQANRELRRQADTDFLTGVANRRKFERRLANELVRARRYDQNLTVAMIDIDFFKRVNDVHGHQAGDAALIYLADTVTLAIRETDLFGRLGGEEFGLLLPQTDASAALLLLERLRATIAAGSFVYDAATIALTVSIGYAGADPHESAEALLGRADEALYAAKQGGRNRVCAANDKVDDAC